MFSSGWSTARCHPAWCWISQKPSRAQNASARNTELWFGCYLLIGLAQNGMAPILLPLASRGDADAGLSYAAFALTGLAAPVMGSWADLEGRHRDLLIWGAAIAAAFFLPLCFLSGGPVFIVLAAGAGFGITAATTAGNVLAIAGLGEEVWNQRIALLQRVVSTGQVLGLLLAGVMAARHMRLAFGVMFLALFAAAALAIAFAPASIIRAPRAKPLAAPAIGGEAGAAGIQQNSHHSSVTQLALFVSVISRHLAQFLGVWFIAYTAMNGVAVLFPVVMIQRYGMPPILPALAYALGICTSLLIYRRVSIWTTRYGAANIVLAGLSARLILFGALALLSLLHASWAGFAVLLVFAVVQFVWPVLAISTIALSVALAPRARGESIGLFNATSSIASSAGAACGGAIFGLFGFSILSVTAVATVGLSAALAWLWFRGLPRPHVR